MSDLRRYFTAVAWKRLSAVEADRSSSNQHELNGVASFQMVLGAERRVGLPTAFVHLDDSEAGLVRADGFVTWYDARESHPSRSEYRLYYPSNVATEKMEAGDLLLVAQTLKGLVVITCAQGSSAESQIAWLFELDLLPDQITAQAKMVAGDPHRSKVAVRMAMESLGFALTADDWDQDWRVAEFESWVANGWPSTSALSEAARQSLASFGDRAAEEPDSALLAVIDREEAIFRALEEAIVAQRLKSGFVSVDEFVNYSLSVQNRRKARAGRAFELHLQEVFRLNAITFSTGVRTERLAKPDFIFPSAGAYGDRSFPDHCLDMLGAKTSCKERWRQVLSEADRIKTKHLVTLEPAISENQTDEMRAQHLQLVVPSAIAETYKKSQRDWVRSLAVFIEMRRDKERASLAP